MFEKLTARERKLAIAVGCLVPATLLFIGVFWVIGKYGENNDQFMILSSAIEQEEDREMDAVKAERRRSYYNSISLSPQIEDASNEYLFWLRKALRESNLKYGTIQPRDGSEFKKSGKVIGKRKRLTFTANGDFEKLTNFLTTFYSVDTLHKISSLKIIPKNEPGNNENKIRTGDLAVNFVVEIASLKAAEENPDFAQNFRQLARSPEDYSTAILRRNMFGPANNPPTISGRTSSSYNSLSKANVNVLAKDADAKDLLKMELVESDVEGAELISAEGGRTGKLSIPGQKEGRYKFKIKVTDSGFPPKEGFAEITVPFKDRKVVEKTPKVVPPPKPPFIHAKETRITGITKLTSGDWQVWIKVRTTGEKYRLAVGDSFKLDQRDWVIKSIQPHAAVIHVDNKLLTFSDRVTFVNPVAEEVLEAVSEEPSTDPVDAPAAELESDEAPTPRKVVS